MAIQIIVKSSESESQRRAREAAAALRRAHYEREQRDGARYRSKAGSKTEIKKALEE
jgi:hypothetical protein